MIVLDWNLVSCDWLVGEWEVTTNVLDRWDESLLCFEATVIGGLKEGGWERAYVGRLRAWEWIEESGEEDALMYGRRGRLK